MKVNSVKCSKNIEKCLKNFETKEAKLPNVQSIETEASACQSVMGQAQIAMQMKQSDAKIDEIINEIVKSRGMKIGRHNGDNHITIGRPVDGFKNLYQDEMRAKCTRDADGFLDEIYIVDNNKKDIYVYKPDGVLKKYFSPDEMNALFDYKYHPEEIHKYLREGRVGGMETEKVLKKTIETIDNLFDSPKKLWKAEKPIILYRALQDKLNPSQAEALTTVGKVFKDSSFVSTTKELSTAKRFLNNNPILQIDVPKGSRYIDMDMLFNIDRTHWREQEFLLPRNSMFVVTGFDEAQRIVKVKLI